jgi:hypothetical protein
MELDVLILWSTADTPFPIFNYRNIIPAMNVVVVVMEMEGPTWNASGKVYRFSQTTVWNLCVTCSVYVRNTPSLSSHPTLQHK